jgi:hypothetical protein
MSPHSGSIVKRPCGFYQATRRPRSFILVRGTCRPQEGHSKPDASRKESKVSASRSSRCEQWGQETFIQQFVSDCLMFGWLAKSKPAQVFCFLVFTKSLLNAGMLKFPADTLKMPAPVAVADDTDKMQHDSAIPAIGKMDQFGIHFSEGFEFIWLTQTL